MATGRLPTFHGRLKVMTEIDNYHINFILEPESVHFSFLLMVKNSLELSYVENLQNQNQSVEMRMKPLKYKQRILQRQLWIVNYYTKSSSNNLSNENRKTGCFQRNDISKIVHFGILIHDLS